MKPTWITLVLLLSSSTGLAAEDLHVSWEELRWQVQTRGLQQYKATIHLSDRLPTDVYDWANGKRKVKIRIARIDDDKLFTEQIAIPRTSVGSLEFRFKRGAKRRLIGTLAGAGLGVALILAPSDSGGEANMGIVAVVPAMAGIGFLLGNVADRQVVHFHLASDDAGKAVGQSPELIGLVGNPSYPSRSPAVAADSFPPYIGFRFPLCAAADSKRGDEHER